MRGLQDRTGVHRIGSAAELPEAGWERLLGPEDFFQSPRWLAVQEVNGATTLDFILRYRSGVPVAGLVTAWADPSVPWLLARPDTLLAMSEADQREGAGHCLAEVAGGDPATLLPSLVCGGRHLGRTRALTAPEAEPSDVDAVVAYAERLARERGAASVCFPHLDVRDAALAEVLRHRGYAWHTSEWYSWLPVPAGGFDEYLAGMTQHRRRRVRGERRMLDAAGVEVRIEPLTAILTARLGQLDANLLAKYGNPASPEFSAKVLARIAEIMGEDALTSVARLDSEIVGFGLVLRWSARGDQQWFGHRAGFDYQAKGELPLYYDVLYYRVLEAAAAAGASVLHAGVGSTPAKLARGCLSSEQRSYLLRLPRERDS
jgi:hypothetical protein